MSPAPRLNVSRMPLSPIVNGTGPGTRQRHKSCLGLPSPAPVKKLRAPPNPNGPSAVTACHRAVCKAQQAAHVVAMAELRAKVTLPLPLPLPLPQPQPPVE